jgi:hypothetical protein
VTAMVLPSRRLDIAEAMVWIVCWTGLTVRWGKLIADSVRRNLLLVRRESIRDNFLEEWDLLCRREFLKLCKLC